MSKKEKKKKKQLRRRFGSEFLSLQNNWMWLSSMLGYHPTELPFSEVPEMAARSWQKWDRNYGTQAMKEILSFTWSHPQNSSASWECETCKQEGLVSSPSNCTPCVFFTLAIANCFRTKCPQGFLQLIFFHWCWIIYYFSSTYSPSQCTLSFLF